MVVLEEKIKMVITLCTSIVILFILCVLVVLIKFFTKDSITTKEIIVGVNLVSSTKLIMNYEEPFTVILEEKEQKVGIQQKELEKDLQNIEEQAEQQVISNENEISEQIEINELNELNEISQNEREIQRIQGIEKSQLSRAGEVRQGSIQEEIIITREPQLEEHEEETVQEIVVEKELPEQVQSSILTEYKGFTTVGKIEIPRTEVDIPILNQVTVEGMKNAPCLLYSTGELNKNGNNLIVGHNFRNNTLFSNNKNLNLGDKIYVTTLDGNRVEYTIFNKFITTAEDVSYLTRDTNNEPEITLSCCTDDDEYRIIILARI